MINITFNNMKGFSLNRCEIDDFISNVSEELYRLCVDSIGFLHFFHLLTCSYSDFVTDVLLFLYLCWIYRLSLTPRLI